jgi:hypothetical protein
MAPRSQKEMIISSSIEDIVFTGRDLGRGGELRQANHHEIPAVGTGPRTIQRGRGNKPKSLEGLLVRRSGSGNDLRDRAGPRALRAAHGRNTQVASRVSLGLKSCRPEISLQHRNHRRRTRRHNGKEALHSGSSLAYPLKARARPLRGPFGAPGTRRRHTPHEGRPCIYKGIFSLAERRDTSGMYHCSSIVFPLSWAAVAAFTGDF